VSRVAYVNGVYQDLRADALPVEERGFQFADGVYEVWAVREGKFLDEEAHFTRLARSLNELRIDAPMGRSALKVVLNETLRRNRVSNGIVYLQITRGAAPRDHAFPKNTAPTLVVTAKSQDMKALNARLERGVSVITHPDERWARCDIKSVSLLPNVLAKQAAKEQGGFEAWLVDADGNVTEGAASNSWIVDAQGHIITRDINANILRGCTRTTLLEVAESLQLKVEERPFSVAEAKAAREAFITSASSPAQSVIAIDGQKIGDGLPGPVARRLREAYLAAATK
jgi:D-alanine transaminase